MTWVRCLACALTLSAPPGQAWAEPQCDPIFSEHVALLRQHLRERQLVDARGELEKAQAGLPAPGCPHASSELTVLEFELLLGEGRLTAADELLRTLELPDEAPVRLKASYLYAAGTLAYRLGQFRRARSHYERLLALDRALAADPRYLAVDLYLVAATYAAEAADHGSREAVIERFQEALGAAQENNGAESVPDLFIQLGKLLGGAEGRVHLDRGLALANAPGELTTAWSALAVNRLRDDPAEARRLIERAVGVAESALRDDGNPWPLLHLLTDRLVVTWSTLPRERAIAESLALLGHVEAVSRQQENPTLRAELFSVWADAYQWLAGRLLESSGEAPALRDLKLAFRVAERYRARSLADSLAENRKGDEFFAGLDEIVASLAADEALLAFQVAPWEDVYGRFGGGSWLVSVSRAGTRAFRLPGRGPLERRVRVYLGLVAERSDAEGGAARLYRDLLAPALAELPGGINKLILIPDGDLHLLPFGALRADAHAPPLAIRYQLARVPSATLWHHWRHASLTVEARNRRSAALVMANPLPEGVPAVALREALGPLPFAAQEGEAVRCRVAGKSLLRVGPEASEAFFRSRDPSAYQLLHFATHAVVDQVHPERSAVYLAPGDGEDGELRPHEIAELDLAGDVVVLSACRSASGNVLRGEGVMGLARAFFQAGASTVLGSLWPLDDREAQLLFEAYYRHLARGRSVQGALQRTQEELRKGGAPVGAWAGVVVLGDGDRVPIPGGSPPRVVGVGAAAVLVAIFFSWVRRRLQVREKPTWLH